MSPAVTVGLGLAGGVGAVSRVVLDGVLSGRRPGVFPLPTLLINVAGSLLLGVLAGLVLFQGVPDAWRAVLGTGFCGGFTTFSTASVASVRLAEQDRPGLAALNALGTLALTLLAAAAGLLLASLL